MNKTLIIEKINNVIALETLKDVWNSLLENNEIKTVELTYEWQMAYWKRFHENADLFVLIIREAGSIIAISPLKLTIKQVLGIRIRCLEIIGARTSNYQDLIIGKNNEDVLICVLDYLIKNRETWDQLDLGHIPEISTTAHFFLEKPTNYPLLRIAETDKCIYLALDKSWEEQKRSLGYNRRHQMERRMVKIERDLGKIRLRKSATEDQLNSDLQIFYDLHRKRWNTTDTPSLFNDPRYCNFYLDAGLQLLPKGQVGLSVLEAGGTPLAHIYFFTFKQSVVLQLQAYDPKYYKYSPAIVLIELFVEETLASGIDEIDFGAYYPYKESWVNHSKNRVNLLVFPKRFFPSVIFSLTKLYLALRARIRQYPRILNTLKIILRKAGVRK